MLLEFQPSEFKFQLFVTLINHPGEPACYTRQLDFILRVLDKQIHIKSKIRNASENCSVEINWGFALCALQSLWHDPSLVGHVLTSPFSCILTPMDEGRDSKTCSQNTTACSYHKTWILYRTKLYRNVLGWNLPYVQSSEDASFPYNLIDLSRPQ